MSDLMYIMLGAINVNIYNILEEVKISSTNNNQT